MPWSGSSPALTSRTLTASPGMKVGFKARATSLTLIAGTDRTPASLAALASIVTTRPPSSRARSTTRVSIASSSCDS